MLLSNTQISTPASTKTRYMAWFRALFLISALWNFAGAVPGTLTTATMFEQEFGYALVDPVMIAIYRGAWVTALLYGFGFLIVAYDPIRHTGIVMMGGLGKALFALNLLWMYSQGWTSNFALLVIGGDAIFVAAFLFYFVSLQRWGHRLL